MGTRVFHSSSSRRSFPPPFWVGFVPLSSVCWTPATTATLCVRSTNGKLDWDVLPTSTCLPALIWTARFWWENAFRLNKGLRREGARRDHSPSTGGRFWFKTTERQRLSTFHSHFSVQQRSIDYSPSVGLFCWLSRQRSKRAKEFFTPRWSSFGPSTTTEGQSWFTLNSQFLGSQQQRGKDDPPSIRLLLLNRGAKIIHLPLTLLPLNNERGEDYPPSIGLFWISTTTRGANILHLPSALFSLFGFQWTLLAPNNRRAIR